MYIVYELLILLYFSIPGYFPAFTCSVQRTWCQAGEVFRRNRRIPYPVWVTLTPPPRRHGDEGDFYNSAALRRRHDLGNHFIAGPAVGPKVQFRFAPA